MLDHGLDEQWVCNDAACTAGNVVVGHVFEMADDRIALLVEERDPIIGLDWDCYHYEEPFRPGHAGSPGPKLAIESTLRELVSFGELWLNEGILDGISIVSSDYVKQARTNQCAHFEGHYEFWWFTNDGRSLIADALGDVFYHIGREHRRTLFIVVPSLSLVVAIGTHEGVFDMADREKAGPVIAPLFVS